MSHEAKGNIHIPAELLAAAKTMVWLQSQPETSGQSSGELFGRALEIVNQTLRDGHHVLLPDGSFVHHGRESWQLGWG